MKSPYADAYAKLYFQILDQMEELERLKKLLADEAAADPSMEPVSLEGDEFRVDYTKRSAENKLKIEPKEFINSTGLYEAITVSAAKAKAKLSEDDFAKYFALVPGSRRLQRVVVLQKTDQKAA